MKVFLKSFFSPLWNSKITVALALSLILVGAAAFFWRGTNLGDIKTVYGQETYTVGGTVSGLTGDGLVLQFERLTGNRSQVSYLSINDNGSFVFEERINDGWLYDVRVTTQPSNPTQTCTVTNGSGTINGQNVTNVTVTCTGGGGGGPGGVSAGNEEEATPLCGFAWGATDETLTSPKMGVGWVSFNSKDCDTNGNGTISSSEAAATPGCPAGLTASYAVSVDDDRYLKGYAWSNNIGWIQFDNLSDFPNGLHGNPGQDARIASNNNTSDLLGWVRAVVAIGRNDGWDGWISLKGSLAGVPGLPGSSGSAYGITFNKNTEKFSGYSWGGEVVGWLKWDSSPGNEVRYCSAPNLTASLVANPVEGIAPLNSMLTASSNQANPDSYRFDCGVGAGWSAPQTGNTYNCLYEAHGRYFFPLVEVKYGDLTANASAQVHTLQDPGSLGAVCSVTPDPLHINEEAEWKAEVSSPDGVTLPYTYTFTFSDGLPPDPDDIETIVSSSTSMTVNKTYSILGKKSVQVSIRDSALLPNTATGDCEEDIGVIVRPKIIEI